MVFMCSIKNRIFSKNYPVHLFFRNMYIIYKIRKFFNILDQFVQLSEVSRSYGNFEIFEIPSNFDIFRGSEILVSNFAAFWKICTHSSGIVIISMCCCFDNTIKKAFEGFWSKASRRFGSGSSIRITFKKRLLPHFLLPKQNCLEDLIQGSHTIKFCTSNINEVDFWCFTT